MDCDVIIVGAGPAGLYLSYRLALAGFTVTIVDRNEKPGGRMQTRMVDGFVVDRGFQVFNTPYPLAADILDYNALDLHNFGEGFLVRYAKQTSRGDVSKLIRVANPLRHPQRLASLFLSGFLDARAVAQGVKWLEPTGRTANTYPFPSGRDDVSLPRGLDQAGVFGPSRRVIEQFMKSLFADENLETSNEFCRVLLWLYATGRPALPVRGIAAIPAYLASRACSAGVTIRLQETVVEVVRDEKQPGIRLESGESLTGRCVVVATDAIDCAALVEENNRRMTGLTTWWFSTPELPNKEKVAALDITGGGPLSHSVVISNINPAASPPGVHLVEASAPLVPGRHITDDVARNHLSYIWGVDTNTWDLVARDDIARSHTLQTPELPVTAPEIVDGVVTCGEWRHSATLNGAFASADSTATMLTYALR